MSGNRLMIQDQGGLSRNARAGDSLLEVVTPLIISADAADTMTVAKMAAGAVTYSGLTAGRNLTTDTGANIAAAFPNMDIGDSFLVEIAVSTAFALTYVAGAGVTLKGKATCAASSHAHVYVVKTGAATFDWIAF